MFSLFYDIRKLGGVSMTANSPFYADFLKLFLKELFRYYKFHSAPDCIFNFFSGLLASSFYRSILEMISFYVFITILYNESGRSIVHSCSEIYGTSLMNRRSFELRGNRESRSRSYFIRSVDFL